jgi:membrane protein implicated in regulation of membrane protease activity
MRHVVTLALFLAAFAVYAYSVGPLFFGAPVLGWALFIVAAAIEWWAWRRTRSRPSQKGDAP